MMRQAREGIVLAGGFGTRLANAVPRVCKPMAPIAGRPFLRFLLDRLSDARFDRVVIADGYRKEQIEDYFGNAYRGMRLIYSSEDDPLYTGGAVKKALSFCESDWVFVLNGDTYCDVDYAELMAAANCSGSDIKALLAVRDVPDAARYGTVSVSSDGTVTSFSEKRGCKDGSAISVGVYCLRRAALDPMPRKFSLEKDWLERVVDKGCLKALKTDGLFVDIGMPEEYELAQTLLAPLARGWKLALFDRDGTINVDTGHLFEREKLELIPGAAENLKRYGVDAEYKIVVVTNQAGIAKGMYTEDQMRELHDALDEKLAERGARVDAYYYCPHHPDYTGECDCRKPKPGMIDKALFDYEANAGECIMFGDKESDRGAAIAAGVPFAFTGGGSVVE